jgi:hypothetical protein
VLRRFSVPRMEEVGGGRKILYNEELFNVYLLNIKIVKSRRLRSALYVARMGAM